VAKGHHFKIGDYFTVAGTNAQAITAIDKTTNTDKDVITLATTLGIAVAAGTVMIQSSNGSNAALITAQAVTGSSYDVVALENLFVDAWVMAVVKEANAPAVDAAIKAALKGVIYV
jgi:hypothetical protein